MTIKAALIKRSYLQHLVSELYVRGNYRASTGKVTSSEVVAGACASWIAICVTAASGITVGAAELIHFTAAGKQREKKADRNVYRQDCRSSVRAIAEARQTF